MNKNDIISTMKILKQHRKYMINDAGGEVLDVSYLGNMNADEQEQQKLAVYLVIEKYKDEYKIFEVERYYVQDLQNGDIKFLAGNNINDGIDTIYLSQSYTQDKKTREDLQKEINNISKEAQISLVNQEKLEKIANELGISVEEVESMVELELEKEKQENEKEQDEQEQNKKLTKDQTEELTQASGKQEVNIDAQFDGMNTLRNELGLSGEYKSIMVVYSEKLKEIGGKDNNSPVSFVAIDKDGKAKIIDSLELDVEAGTRPTNEAIKIDNDGTARQNVNTLSRYKIAGTNKTLSVERGQYGEMNVYHGQKTKEENRPVEFQLETNSIRPTSREMKNLQKQNQGQYHIDDIENEFAEHGKHGEKEVKGIENFDGNMETATHIHDSVENNEAIIQKWSEKIMDSEIISDVFTDREVQEMIDKYIKKHTDEKIEIEEIEKEIEADAQIYYRGRTEHE